MPNELTPEALAELDFPDTDEALVALLRSVADHLNLGCVAQAADRIEALARENQKRHIGEQRCPVCGVRFELIEDVDAHIASLATPPQPEEPE